MSERIHVLLIDDSEMMRKTLKYLLRLSGFKVYLAKNGRVGLKVARRIKPQLILLDWMMPEMDGLEVLSELKHNAKTEHIPVFMLTAKSKIGDIDRAFDIGADGYITKPFEADKVGTLVKKKLIAHLNKVNAVHI